MLSGPNIAEEIARGLPAAAVIASDDLELAVRLRRRPFDDLPRVRERGRGRCRALCGRYNVDRARRRWCGRARDWGHGKAALVARGLAER